jgi:hypothetical protein
MQHYLLISLLFLSSLGCRSQENPILEFQKNLIDSEQTGSNIALVYKDGEVVYNHKYYI